MVYSTANDVRELLPDLLYYDDNVGVIASGTALTLTNSAEAVPTILKGGTTLTLTTDFTFARPRAVTLLVAANGEYFTAHTHVAFSDPQIEIHIATSDRFIDNEFVNLTTPASGYLGDWSKYLTAAAILRIKAKGDPNMLKWADSMEKIANDGMAAYLARTSAGVFDDSGISRDDSTPVPSFKLDQGNYTNYESNND